MTLLRSPSLRNPLPWALAALMLLVLGLPSSKPLFAALFPALDRPLYEQDSFIALLSLEAGPSLHVARRIRCPSARAGRGTRRHRPVDRLRPDATVE